MEVNIKIINSTNLVIHALFHKFTKIQKEFKEATGHTISITETYRPQSRQDYLYEIGRTKDGSVVTNTRESMHKWGLAIDVCGDIDPEKEGRQDPWSISWPTLGSIVISNGVVWGGNWGDYCHLEILGPYDKKQIKDMVEKEGLLYVWQRINSYYAY